MSDMSEIDPELAELLSNVESISRGEPEKPEPEPEPVVADSEPQKPDVLPPDVLPPDVLPPDVLPPEQPSSDVKDSVVLDDFEQSLGEKSDVTKKPSRIKTDSIIEQEDPRLAKIKDGLFKLLNNVMSTADSQMEEFHEDRKKADEALDVLLAKVSSGSPMSAAEVTAVPMLIQIKVDASANRSKYMDSVAKLFASLKKNDAISTGESSGKLKQDEVLKILSNSRDDDEDDDG